jgi:hypothetical protein
MGDEKEWWEDDEEWWEVMGRWRGVMGYKRSDGRRKGVTNH